MAKAAGAAPKATGATTQVLDMTNVKERGEHNPKRKPAGDYRAKIIKVVDHATGGKGVPNQWCFTVALSTDARATYGHYCSWETDKLWKVRNLALAAGMAVPKKKIKLDPNKLVGKEIGITLDDDEYEGRPKSQITATFPVSELTGDEPDADEDETEDDDDADEEDIDEVDLEEV